MITGSQPSTSGSPKLEHVLGHHPGEDIVSGAVRDRAQVGAEAKSGSPHPGLNIDEALHDHDVFSWCGKVEIISTPGHTPGHICLYLHEFKTLIAGDALFLQNGELVISLPMFTYDMEQAKKSVKKLLDYDIEKIICYHGGVYEGNIKEALRKISMS